MSDELRFSSCKHLPQITVKVKTLFHHLATNDSSALDYIHVHAKILLLLDQILPEKKSHTHSCCIASLVCTCMLKVIVHS